MKKFELVVLLMIVLGMAAPVRGAVLELHWDFEGTGSTEVAQVGQNGTLEGTATRGTVLGVPEYKDGIMSFDGSGRVDGGPWVGAPMDGGDFTISTIIRSDNYATPTQSAVTWDGMLLGPSWGKAYSMWITGVGYNESWWIEGYVDTWMDNDWHQLAMTYKHGADPCDLHERTLFVDGQVVLSEDSSLWGPPSVPDPGLRPQLLDPAGDTGFGYYERIFCVGDYSDDWIGPKDWPFIGDVADVKVYDGILSDAEIYDRYVADIVPEPATIALLSCGFALMRRRRNS